MIKKTKNLTSNRSLDYLEHSNRDAKKLLFFIHGFPDDPYVWSHQFQYFKDTFHIIAPFAPTEKNNLRFDDITNDYLELINKFHVEEVIIIAHDLGGPLTVKMLQKNIISKAILINAPSIEQMFLRLKDINQLKKSWYIFLFQFLSISKKIINHSWDRIILKVIKDNNLTNIHHFKKINALKSLYFYKTFFNSLKDLDKNKLKKTKVPCHFIWSLKDPYLNIPNDNELKLLFQFYSIDIINHYHWPMLENPQLINNLIKENL